MRVRDYPKLQKQKKIVPSLLPAFGSGRGRGRGWLGGASKLAPGEQAGTCCGGALARGKREPGRGPVLANNAGGVTHRSRKKTVHQ